MHKEPKSEINDPQADSSNAPSSKLNNADLGLWIERELEALELLFEDFSTAKSTRNYFGR